METDIYDHYIAVDWSIKNMAIARMTKKSNAIKVVDVPSDIVELKVYLEALKGTIALTVEETTTAQWLYTELKKCVDRILICDPYRNRRMGHCLSAVKRWTQDGQDRRGEVGSIGRVSSL